VKRSFEVAFEVSNDGEYLIRRGISFHIWGEAEEKYFDTDMIINA